VNWPSVRLAELSKVITKGTTPTSIGFEFSNDGVRFLRVQNIDGTVNYERDTLFIDESTHQALKRSQIQPGDILVSIAGTIGRSGVVPEDSPPLNCNQAVAIVRTKWSVSTVSAELAREFRCSKTDDRSNGNGHHIQPKPHSGRKPHGSGPVTIFSVSLIIPPPKLGSKSRSHHNTRRAASITY
jgi:hypothetical protein